MRQRRRDRSTFLDITSKVDSSDGERGLLSIAFALDYATSGLFYVYYTAKSPLGQITIEEHRVDPANPDRADPSYARPLVTIPHDQQANHNGGQLQFGPDGALYAGTGDGGSGGDPSGNAPGHHARRPPPSASGGQPRLPPRQAPAHRPGHRRGHDLRLRPAQPLALLLRPQHRRPHHRRRRPGPLRGGRLRRRRPGDGAGANYGWNQYEGAAHLSGQRAGGRGAGHGPAGHRVPARPGVLDHRRLRGARPGAARARRHLPLRRQLHRRHLRRHAARRARRARWASPSPTCRASARTAAGASTRRRSAAPSTASRAAARAPGRRRSSAGCPPGSPRARPPPARPPRAGVHPAARRRAPARAAHRLRRRPRALRRAVHRAARAVACSSRARAHAAAARGPAHAHRAGDAGGRRAHDAAPEALQGDAPRDQALAGAARPAGHGAHLRARGGSRRATRAARRGACGSCGSRSATSAPPASSQQ